MTAAMVDATAEVAQNPTKRSVTLRRLLGNSYSRIGLAILAALTIFAIVVPLLAASDATTLQPLRKLLSPAVFEQRPGAPFFGTDHLGRDLGAMAALGLRTSVMIGGAAVLLSALIGWVIGGIGGFFGGYLDDACGRLMDFFGAFPGLLLIIGLMAALGPSPRNLVIVLALSTWESFGRLARATALQLRSLAYIDAAKVAGATRLRMLLTHCRLNTLPVIVSLGVIQLPRIILGEATLSFLGFGLDESSSSLGSIISEERDYLQVNSWSLTVPGVVLALLCIGTALTGLGMRGEK